jgi:hypothetical protein
LLSELHIYHQLTEGRHKSFYQIVLVLEWLDRYFLFRENNSLYFID